MHTFRLGDASVKPRLRCIAASEDGLRHNARMEAATVLMIHGAGGGAWAWRVWARVFEAAGWRVRLPELVPAEAGLAHTNLEHYREQLRAAWHAACSESAAPCVAIGASLGGLLALDLAQDAAAAVLINPLPAAPWHARLPARAPYPPVVPWGRDASLAGTARALPDADSATWRYAYRRWRDEAGAVLNAVRAGVSLARPACPSLLLASADDDDVPAALSAEYARALGTQYLLLPDASHVGPLLGRQAAHIARLALSWLASLPPSS
jgi:pimeloyl-ACP methyl ester carboxylesterase